MNLPPSSSAGQRRKVPPLKRIGFFFQRLSVWNKVALVLLLLSPLFAFAGLKLLKPVYKSWKAQNSLKIAATALENDDASAASLAFRTAIQTQPRNPLVWRRVGEYLDSVGSPESFSVWKRVVALDPDDEAARFALIDSAIKLNKIEIAQQNLADLPVGLKKTEEFHRAAASVALAQNDAVTAIRELTTVLKLNPEAKVSEWDLLRVRSVDPDPEVHSVARKQLRELAEEDGEFSQDALRHLVRLALATKDFYTANRTAEDLIAQDDATGQDQILHLDTEFAVQSFTLPNSIAKILEYAETYPESAAEITAYLSARGLNDRLETWFGSLSPEISEQTSLQLAKFNYARQMGDWDGVFSVLSGDNSPHPFSPTLIDEVRTSLEDYRRGDDGALAAWNKAVFTAENNPGATYVMATLAQAVGWTEAYSQALWSSASSLKDRPEIWIDVVKMELASRNSAGILRALSGAVRADPDDRQLRNDWVLMNLLMRKGDLKELLELARGNAEHDPGNPFFATTHGLALALSGQTDEAVAALDNLSEEARAQPKKALYVGTIFAMAGRADEAEEFLVRADEASQTFLPEEETMREDALEIVSGRASREDEVRQITQRAEGTEEERTEFAATLKAQIDADQEGMSSEKITETLRQAATDRRSPEEIEKLMSEVRATQTESAATPE